MSSGRTAAAAAERVGSGAGRVLRAWRGLPQERRLAAGSAIGLFVTLFLPWYQETVIPTGSARPSALPSASLTGWAAFSFVEAAVLLVAAGVLTLLFVRAEGRAFHVPGGDGGVITAAGFWTCVLIIWRIFDKQGTSSHNQFVTTSGIEWGIFIALVVAAVMAYAGNRIRAANQPEPPLPGEEALLKREPDTGGRAQRRAWTPRPVAADAPRQSRPDAPAQSRPDAPAQSRPDAPAQSRPDAPARSRADAPAQSRPDAPARSRADAPAQSRADAPPQPRPEVPARPTRRRRPLPESPQRGPQVAGDQAAGQPAPSPQPTRPPRSDSGRADPVAADDPPTRRLASDQQQTRPLRTGAADASERNQAPRTGPDNERARNQAPRTGPDNERARNQAPRTGPDNERARTLPLDPVPADADWEIGEFRTQRLTRDERDPDRAERPDDQLTIPLEHDDG